MPTAQEKADFSKRLRFALEKNAASIKGPTRLADQFNLRYDGTGISPQTAHKWLSGRSIPSPDKIATLAKWLSVSEHWLHYGPAPHESAARKTKPADKYPPSNEMLTLASKIAALPEHQRYLVEELIDQLYERDERGR